MTRRWIVASSLGLAAGIPGGVALGAPLEVIVGAMVVTPLMMGLSGFFLGTSQWLVLREGLERAGRWIGLTVLGMGAGLTLALVAVEEGGALITGAPVRMSTTGTAGLLLSVMVLGLMGGAVLGWVQAFALRDRAGAPAQWVTASTFGLTAGFLCGGIAALPVGGMASAPGLVLFLVVSGLVYSSITARALQPLVPAP